MAWVTVPGSNNIWEFENTATAANTYPDSADGANSTVSGGIRTYTKPGTSDVTETYLRVRKKGQINHYLNSEDVQSWINNNMTITQNATVAPDGLTTADKMIPTTAVAPHYRRQDFAMTAPYTYSVFVKPAGYNFIKLFAGNSSTCSANFNLATGEVGTTGGTGFGSAAISSLENGWYRCQITNTTNALQGPGGIYVTSVPSNPVTGLFSEAGDGTSGVFVWGGMINSGTFASRYIKTGASASTTIERGEVSKTYYDAQ